MMVQQKIYQAILPNQNRKKKAKLTFAHCIIKKIKKDYSAFTIILCVDLYSGFSLNRHFTFR